MQTGITLTVVHRLTPTPGVEQTVVRIRTDRQPVPPRRPDLVIPLLLQQEMMAVQQEAAEVPTVAVVAEAKEAEAETNFNTSFYAT